MRVPKATTLLSSLIALVAAAGAWFYLAPSALGGSTTYVVTDGVSMEPHFHGGDLVLVRSQSSYHVGEIVAYHNTMLHTIVLHRIVGRSGSAYLFKGDNNDFVDPDHPARSQLIGALWLHVAAAGKILESLRSPLAVGALVGLATLLFCGGAFTRTRRRRRRSNADLPPPPPPSPSLTPRSAPAPVGGFVAGGFVALLPFAALAAISFGQSPTAALPFSVPYHQTGAFSYTADAHPGPVYPRNRVVTGAPVFTRVVDSVNVRFAYALRASRERNVAGTIGLDATLSSTSGWQQTLTLEPPKPFHGDSALADATLNLRSITRLVSAIEKATSVSGQYTLTLDPKVSASGAVGGVLLHTTYSPALPFTLSQFELERYAPVPSAIQGAPASASPLDPSSTGSVTGHRTEPRFVSLGIARLSFAVARRVAIGGAALVLLALAALIAVVRRGRRDESAAIRARYDHWIVPVAHVKRRRRLATIDVADMDALARIAERYERVILHERGVDGEAFWVADESAQYRYAIAHPSGPHDDRARLRRWRTTRRADPPEIEPLASRANGHSQPSRRRSRDADGAPKTPTAVR
jgi:signal peptidase I